MFWRLWPFEGKQCSHHAFDVYTYSSLRGTINVRCLDKCFLPFMLLVPGNLTCISTQLTVPDLMHASRLMIEELKCQSQSELRCEEADLHVLLTDVRQLIWI